ncbi:MAG: motility protein A, partial [Treponema sp.]|nr:motility protein A [Treponema sp.]
MDISSIIGLAGAFGMIVMSIVTGGGSLMSVVDLPSFLMVVLGSWFALLLATSLTEGLGIFSLIGRTFRIPVFNEQ